MSDENFLVEADVPMPRRNHRLVKYPFGAMKVGDSFSMSAKSRSLIQNAAYAYGKFNKMKFSIRKIPSENGSEQTYRCWRIK